ncbi:MAG: beta-N-acetylhexosaminidase, partial [Muricauda sp.]|nr:beta-N-acetylhexosaminidase [Allomuricauda sp.]
MIYRSILLFVAVLCIAACQTEKKEINFPKTDLASAPLIPKPIKTISTGSAFGLDAGTAIYTTTTDPEFEKVGQFLSDQIKSKT